MEQKCTLRAWIAIFRKCVCAGSRSRVWWVNSRESLPRSVADPFIQVVDDLGTAIVEHQLGGSAFRSTDGKSRCFAALERLFRPGRDKFPLDLRREPKDRCGYRGRQRFGRAPSDSWRCAPSRLDLRPPAATPALGEWIALNERPRLRPARHPHRPSRAVARSPGLSKTSDRWWCPPRTRSEQCLESCNSRALRASGSRLLRVGGHSKIGVIGHGFSETVVGRCCGRSPSTTIAWDRSLSVHRIRSLSLDTDVRIADTRPDFRAFRCPMTKRQRRG